MLFKIDSSSSPKTELGYFVPEAIFLDSLINRKQSRAKPRLYRVRFKIIEDGQVIKNVWVTKEGWTLNIAPLNSMILRIIVLLKLLLFQRFETAKITHFGVSLLLSLSVAGQK